MLKLEHSLWKGIAKNDKRNAMLILDDSVIDYSRLPNKQLYAFEPLYFFPLL